MQLVLTRTPGFKGSLLKKGEEITGARIRDLGARLGATVTVAHEVEAVAQSLDPAL